MSLAPGWPRLAAVIVTAVLLPLRAHADEARIRLNGAACKGLDAAQTERLLDIELSQYVASLRDGPPIEVRLLCEGSRMVMSIRETSKGQELSREEVLPPPGHPGRERTAAIKIAQQFLVTWLAILTAPAPAPLPATPSPAPSPAPVVSRWEAGASFAARMRDVAHPFIGWRPSLRAGVTRAGRWSFFGVAAFERAQASRDSGVVNTTFFSLGGGAEWRSQPWQRISLGAQFSGSALIAQIAGNPSRPSTEGAGASGFGGELALAVGPSFALGPVRLTVAPELGLTLPTFAAAVDGEETVRASGVFFGAALTVTGSPVQ